MKKEKESWSSGKINPQDFYMDARDIPLPSHIRYYDDFSEKLRTIKTTSTKWVAIVDGVRATVRWELVPEGSQDFLKKFLVWSFGRYDPTTAAANLQCTNQLCAQWHEALTWLANPSDAKDNWELKGYGNIPVHITRVLRSCSIFMCEMSLCGWSTDDKQFLKGWKWHLPSGETERNPYYFKPGEKVRINNYFNSFLSNLSANENLYELLDATILYWTFQFGMRPNQIARLTDPDIEIVSFDGSPSVHATFYKIKQQDVLLKEPMLRKMKKEWAPILVRYLEVFRNKNIINKETVAVNSIYNLTPEEVSKRITRLSKRLLGRSINPTLYRHIACQRLADLGMNQLQLAEFMGHSEIDTCLIYFENSEIQGQVVNRALGLSPIYQRVQEVADFGFIKPAEMESLSADKQVGGAAHGIPLAGIGGCSIGQSLCELSPAMSCYTCPKFLPVHDIDLHKVVAKDLREVIVMFESAGRNDQSNPAFTQLTHTMTQLSDIIDRLETSDE